ncbi:uncharacterized protein LOC131438661 [Malaya genurostris]|uniref:uncharacterized protein LOC131438661 n=1 Tax=Malaya genurostris TaxID=325434 RepID=UPI0026F3DD87|nr:uncharacterized protein LOC131438661 [Malaya genurostris]
MRKNMITTLDINLNIDVNTVETCSRMVQTVIKVLLFQRCQIPFCFEVFQSIVKKIPSSPVESPDENPAYNNFQIRRQCNAASKLLESISHLFEELSVAIKESQQTLQFMVLFGTTVYTAKEAFLINVPKINRNHHRNSSEAALKQLAMKLTLADEIQLKPKVKGTTNTFLLIGMNSSESFKNSTLRADLDSDTWHLLEEYEVPQKCPTLVINLTRQMDSMEIYCDMTSKLNIGNSSKEVVPVCDKVMWYKIGNGLKGFKDVLIKGKSVWDYAQGR